MALIYLPWNLFRIIYPTVCRGGFTGGGGVGGGGMAEKKKKYCAPGKNTKTQHK